MRSINTSCASTARSSWSTCPRLSESQVKNLEGYVRDGGGVGIFLGPKVDPVAYNKLLYRDGEGLFPALLANEATKPPTEEEKERARTGALIQQILVRDSKAKTHRALAGLFTNERGDVEKGGDIEPFFRFPHVYQHWPISRLGKWRQDPSVNELLCLPNNSPLSLMEPRVAALINAVKEKYLEPKFQKYRDAIDQQFNKIRSLFNETTPMTELARQLDRLLADQINEGEENEALFRDFWGQPEMADARMTAQALRDSCKYGDPLYLTKRFRNGRVVVMTTDAGGTPGGSTATGLPWTDWPTTASWGMVMEEMEKYLAGGGAEENRSVGTPFSISLEEGRYGALVGRAILTTDTSKPDRGSAPLQFNDIGDQPLSTKGGSLQLSFSDPRPGAYIFTLNPLPGEDGKAKPPEFLTTVFNIDTAREGDAATCQGQRPGRTGQGCGNPCGRRHELARFSEAKANGHVERSVDLSRHPAGVGNGAGDGGATEPPRQTG